MPGARRILLIALVPLALAGCGSPTAANKPISIKQMTHPVIVPNPTEHPDAWYRPNPIVVHVGQTITWTNKDNDLHDVTAVNGAFYSGPLVEGAKFSWTPTRPGTYPYFCTIHTGMHGKITVRP